MSTPRAEFRVCSAQKPGRTHVRLRQELDQNLLVHPLIAVGSTCMGALVVGLTRTPVSPYQTTLCKTKGLWALGFVETPGFCPKAVFFVTSSQASFSFDLIVILASLRPQKDVSQERAANSLKKKRLRGSCRLKATWDACHFIL